MRITARISGAGQNGMSRIPTLTVDSIDDELCTNGELDEAKCRRALNIDGSVQIASNDCLPIFAFAVEMLKQVHRACQRLIDDHDEANVRGEAETKDDIHSQRKMNQGRVVFVRQDIGYSHATRTLKFRIDIQNPRNVPGVAMRIAKDYALIVARIANNIADQLGAAHGGWNFSFTGGDGCPDVFSEARAIDTRLNANAKRKDCPNRVNGYCSPSRPDCPCFVRGKCVEVKE